MIPDLWEHQARDIQRYVSSDLSLFNTSDPGTGKTRTIIEVIRRRKIPTLILAPKSILRCAWGNDFDHYAPEIQYTIATADNRAEAMSSPALVKITNVDALKWLNDNPKYLEQFRGGFLVIDESTALKNPKSKRTAAAIAMRPMFAGCTCMSGTPSPQGVIDLWAQMYLVDMGQRLGASYYRFKNTCYTPVLKGKFTEWKEKEGAADSVAAQIADITIRNRREDCMDLPPNQIVWREIELSPKHMKQYKELKVNALLELESGDVSAVNAAALATKLLQTVSGAVYDQEQVVHLIDSERYELIADLIEERPQTVVFFIWKHQRDQIMEILDKRGISYGLIDGSVTRKNAREESVEAFQAGMLRAMLCHPKSAGHGLTLTAGVATIWSSPTYDAEHFEQANARIYRGGQTKSTETILIHAKGTIEDKVFSALFEKKFKMANLLETFL